MEASMAPEPTNTERPTTVLLLHGLMSNADAWAAVAAHLEDHPLRLITTDLPGFRTRRATCDDASLGGMVDALMPSIEREPPDVVVGHSMGSIVALEIGRRLAGHVTAVGVIGLPVYAMPEPAFDLDLRRLFHRAVLRSDRLAHAGCRVMHRTRRAWLPLTPLILPREPRAVVESAFDHAEAAHHGALHDIIFGGHVGRIAPAIDAPVSALHGDHDRTALPGPAGEIAARFGWDWRLVEGGHQLHTRQPELVAAWIAALAGRPKRDSIAP
jgi:pimeloyl-ACP methyl ester carboxylesterase